MTYQLRYKLLVIGFSLLNHVSSQEMEDKQMYSNKNELTITYNIYTGYDGLPILYRSEYYDKYALSSGYGLEYVRLIDPINALSLSTNYYYHNYQKSRFEMESGTVFKKYFVSGQLNYRRSLFDLNSSQLSVALGLMFRAGSELVHGGVHGGALGPGSSYGSVHTIADIGFPCGIHYRHQLGKFLHFKIGTEHTLFPYVRDSKKNLQFDYDWDKGTSRNMTKFYFGIGVNF